MTNDHDDKQQITIIINARPHQVSKGEISFDQVVTLSGLPRDPNTIFTITYSRGDDHKPKGQLVEGESVKVKDGMNFNVTPTNKS